MDDRKPLKSGAIIKMPNQGQYIIREKIGAGGLSLIYAAETKNNGYPVIIKEFFPLKYAIRADKTQKACNVKKDRVYPEEHYEERFELALRAFEQEGTLGSSARMHNFQVLSFSDCGGGYAVLPRWSADSCTFGELVRKWRRSPPVSVDPVFRDLGRLQFSLTAISSLLSAVSALHEQNILHLDISADNVVWAGQDPTSPANGSAFLADFGCSVYMKNESYAAEMALSCSEDYAAPEYKQTDGQLTKASDLYSVGRLLSFLCFGRNAFHGHAVLSNLVRRLNIAERFSKQLLAILEKSTAESARERYQTAAEMQAAVNELLSALPLHPINEDCSAAFTLYSLKSMLEGSQDTHYSWAHELCDRRELAFELTPEETEKLYRPVTPNANRHFRSDEEFLRAVLPDAIYGYLMEQIFQAADRQVAVTSIMSCNYSDEWKDNVCRMLRCENYQLPPLIAKCGNLLQNKNSFEDAINFLLKVDGEDIRYFEKCYYYVHVVLESREEKSGLLALVVILALLGPGSFYKFTQGSPSEASKLFELKTY